VLIHNLNLGQAPTINPTTISSKVTTALLLCIARVAPEAGGVVNDFVRDVVDDILGLVQNMSFFGSGTRPSKNPSEPTSNGAYYTIPVKLSFQNRQTALRVTEILKGKYKLQVTTPYHKSLRASFALVQKKVRAKNPDYQVRVNLDMNKRSLKAFIRPDVDNADKYPWEFVGQPIPLPEDALNPKFTDIEKITLSTTVCRLSGSQSEMETSEPTVVPSKEGGGRASPSKKTPNKTGSVSGSGSGSGMGGPGAGIALQNRFLPLTHVPSPSENENGAAAT
jgi:hypothetical protein